FVELLTRHHHRKPLSKTRPAGHVLPSLRGRIGDAVQVYETAVRHRHQRGLCPLADVALLHRVNLPAASGLLEGVLAVGADHIDFLGSESTHSRNTAPISALFGLWTS